MLVFIEFKRVLLHYIDPLEVQYYWSTSRISIFASLVVGLLIIIFNVSHLPLNILSWDVFGYYLVLPQVFIHHDLMIKDPTPIMEAISTYGSTSTFYQAFPSRDGMMVMRYSMGMGILYLPSFLIGHSIALIGNHPVDGYSLPYQYAVLGGGMVYLIAGFFFLRSVLRRYLSDLITAFVILIIYLGSNLLFHSSFYGSNAMSHNYLFALYGLILYLSERWHRTQSKRVFVLLFSICGLAILARPTELVCVLIPLLWGIGHPKDLTMRVKKWIKDGTLLKATAILLLIGSIQFIYWRVNTGHFINRNFLGNVGEGMDWLRPHLGASLFSFRKGWFTYTPIALVAIAGILYVYHKQRNLFLMLSVYLVLNIYLVSCWSNWWYAQSFGQRAYIPSLAVIALPLGFSLQWLGTNLKRLLPGIIVISLLLILNLFQTWQYIEGILQPDRMTASYYFEVFGETEIPDQADTLLLVDRTWSPDRNFDNRRHYQCILDTTLYMQDTIGGGRQFSKVFQWPFNEISEKDHMWVSLEAVIEPLTGASFDDIQIVIHMQRHGKAYAYETYNKIVLQDSAKIIIQGDYLSPELRRKSDKLKSYIYANGDNIYLARQLRLQFWERK